MKFIQSASTRRILPRKKPSCFLKWESKNISDWKNLITIFGKGKAQTRQSDLKVLVNALYLSMKKKV